MPIMQALIVGGGQPESVIVETDTTTPKPLVTILPDIRSAVFDPSVIFGAKIIDVELWAGGGASGSARDGVSGDGGAGGYVKARINLSNIDGVEIKVGGGGGTPDYYAIPSDEYLTENIADIISIGTSSANSQVALTTPFEVGAARSTTVATEGSNPAVSYISSSSDSSVIQLLTTSSVGDIILLASSCDEGNISLATGFSDISAGAGNPSYRLSYKYVATANETISGLEATINGRPVSHVAQVFRGVNPIATEGVISQGLQTNPGLPTLPDATSELTGCMLASFGFFDNVGLLPTEITAPTGHTNLISASSNSVLPIEPVTTLTGNTFVATQPTDTSFTVGGLTPGDFVVVVAGSDGQNPTPGTIPAGWTTIETGGVNPGRWAAYTFASATSITLSGLDVPGGVNNIAYAVLAFSGVDPEPLINNIDYDFVNGTGTPNPPPLTTSVNGCMVVALGILDNVSRTPTAPAGYTLGPFASTPETVDPDTGDVDDSVTVMSAYQLQTTSGLVNPNSFDTGIPGQPWTAGTIILNPRKIDSTVMAANRALPAANTYTNDSFGIIGASEASVGTSILLVRNNNFVPSSSTMTITGSVVGDIIIVASVNDNAIPSLPSLPSGLFTNISGGTGYRLSWKRVEATDIDVLGQVVISGLTTLGQDNNGNSALIRHVAYVYRSASGIDFTLPPVNGTTATISPSDISAPADEDLGQYACIPFAFLRNVSLTTGITATDPNYTLGTIYPVGTNSTGISEATLVNAFRSGLPNNLTETPTDFAITGVNPDLRNWSSVTVALSPSATSSTFSGSINLPVGTQVGDLVLVASVSDNSNNPGPPPTTSLNTPIWAAGASSYTSLFNENNNTPSYQLSYKFVEDATETTVDGLTTVTFTNNGNPRGTAHTVQVFRGVNPLLPILSSGPSTGNDTQPNPPSIGIASSRNAVVSFAFVDDRSVTVTGTPAGYTLGPVASVGTNPNSNTEATVMSAYTLTPNFPSEDPPNFTISNGDDWDAVTILLQNNITQRFYPSDPGGCGGSSGGYTALFDNLTKDLILMVGAGGGGGGSSVIPIGAAAGTPASAAYRSAGGSGGVGGGNGNAGGNGSSGLSFLEGTSFAIAGQFGSGGTLISGGIGGNATQTGSPTLLVSNPGETGVAYTNNTSGSRGANSPYNTSDIPLQGANATGGYIAGRGGGSSRTNSTLSDATIPSDCGGAGGPGYYGGGGGGPGLYGGGGGGGGGCSYHDPSIVTIISSEVGVGTNPAGQGSGFWNFPIAVGGSRVIGNNTSPIPATTTSIGNSGGDGRVVITYLTV